MKFENVWFLECRSILSSRARSYSLPRRRRGRKVLSTTLICFGSLHRFAGAVGGGAPNYCLVLRRRLRFRARPQTASVPCRGCRCRGWRPGSLSDLMLHETAVSWIRNKEGLTLPRRPWTESREAFAVRLKQIVAAINDEHDVDGLCRELPMRISKLIEKKGSKLRK